MPAPGDGHTHEEHSHAGSMAKHWLTGSDQPLNGMKLIGKATLNVLEPGDGREITAVEEKRLHVCHEHMSFKQEVVRLRQFGIGEERLSASDGHVSFANADASFVRRAIVYLLHVKGALVLSVGLSLARSGYRGVAERLARKVN